MELKQIKELMAAMERNGTKRLMLKEKDFELVLEREEQVRQPSDYPPAYFSRYDESLDEAAGRSRANQALSRGAEMLAGRTAAAIPDSVDTDHVFVTSPMVGTFYSAASPDAPSFVKPGDKVEKDTIVCVIEAMKVMNEVKAGVSGIIVEVLVDNAHPVEFGSKLFRVK